MKNSFSLYNKYLRVKDNFISNLEIKKNKKIILLENKLKEIELKNIEYDNFITNLLQKKKKKKLIENLELPKNDEESIVIKKFKETIEYLRDRISYLEKKVNNNNVVIFDKNESKLLDKKLENKIDINFVTNENYLTIKKNINLYFFKNIIIDNFYSNNFRIFVNSINIENKDLILNNKYYNIYLDKFINLVDRKKDNFCLFNSYNNDFKGIICLNSFLKKELQNKNSILYKELTYFDFNEINNKITNVIELKLYKKHFIWYNNKQLDVLRQKYFLPSTFIIGIYGEINDFNFPSELINSITKLIEEKNMNIILLLMENNGNNINNNLSEKKKELINSLVWIKKLKIPYNLIINYIRLCDLLIYSYQDYSPYISTSLDILLYKMSNKPILSSYGYLNEKLLKDTYHQFLISKTAKLIPPFKLIKNENLKQNYINKFLNNNICQNNICQNNIKIIKNFILDIKKIKNQNKILIFQDSLAIRSWKLGFTLNKLGYDISYAYERYNFDFNYVNLDTNFVKKFYKVKNFNIFKYLVHQFDFVFIINGWNPNGHLLSKTDLGLIYYIGDLQILRHKLIKDGLNNISVKREKEIFNSDNKIIFTNKYMVKKLIDLHKQNFKKEFIVIPNSHLETSQNYEEIKFLKNNKKIVDYTNKNFFKLVYIGSVNINSNTHRDMVNIFLQICNENIRLDIYCTVHNKKKIENVLGENKYITIKEPIAQNNIVNVLKNYDYGFCFFNMDFLDSEYIHISQPNKFYDYYYAKIPIICNKTDSFEGFINENKIGFCIDKVNEINIENLQRKFDFTNNNIKTYNDLIINNKELILSYENKTNNKYYKYLYVSSSIKFFKKMTMKKYNLREYIKEEHINEPTLFYGIYNQEDVNIALAHRGKKKMMFGGSDCRYKMFEENKNILANNNIEIVCQSAHLYNHLLRLGYPKNLSILNPFTPAQITDFYDRENKKGSNIYIYTSTKNPEVYGNDIYEQVIDKLKNKFNFIICESGTTNDIKSIYKKCFIGLRLTRFDGLGCTNIELGLMGIKSVSNNLSPNCLPWKTVDDVCRHIIRESLTIDMANQELADKTLEFISKEFNFLKL